MNDICGDKRISPQWGLAIEGHTYSRAKPYSIDDGLTARRKNMEPRCLTTARLPIGNIYR